jgi:BioD-like phosphotransacetylase family protein
MRAFNNTITAHSNRTHPCRRTFIEENHVCASHAVALARHYSAAPTQPHKEASALYVTSALGRKSPSPVLLGLMERFQRHHPSVGFFMPVGTDFMPGSNPPIPKHAALLMAHCALQDPPATMVGVSEADAEALIASGREDEFVDRVWTAYGRHRSGKDLVLIEGAAVEGVGAPVEFHGRLAAELGAPVLLTVDFRRDETVTVDEAVARAVIAGHEVKSAGADLLGIIINKMPADASEAMKTEIKEQLQSKGMHCFGMVPWDPIIGAVRVNELSAALNARQLAGDGLDSTVSGIVIAGQSAGCLLDELDRAAHVLCADSMSGQRPVVMASADRADVALTLAAAHASGAGPVIAALILCNASHMRLP